MTTIDAQVIKTSTATNNGVSKNGTLWTQFDNGNVELTAKNGSKSVINPKALGMTLDDAIKSFEDQFQELNDTIHISDQEYLELIEDVLGQPKTESLESFQLTTSTTSGIPNGLALLPIFMSLSTRGLQNLISLMGFFPLPVLNSLGQWVVGFQHVIEENELDIYNSSPMTMDSATQVLLDEIMNVFIPLLQSLIRVPLTQQQFDSLIGSIVLMGVTKFIDSGISNAINGGDYQGGGSIRECYNGTNGEYDPAKGYAADTQSLGIQNNTDQEGSTTIADPGIIGKLQPSAPTESKLLYTPVSGLIEAINAAAKQAKQMIPFDMAAILYGFAHHESSMGNRLTEENSTAGGIYHFTKTTWIDLVKKFGDMVPGLEAYAEQLKNTPTIPLKQQVEQLRFDPLLSSKILVCAVELIYVPELKRQGLPVGIGSIWNAFYDIGSLKVNVANKLNWDSVGTGTQYAAKYFR